MRKFIHQWFLSALLLLNLSAPSRAADDLTIFADVLENGWHDYSWSITEQISTTVVHSGSDSVGITLQGWGAYYLDHYAFNPQLYANLTFWVNGGSTGGQKLIVQATLDGNPQAQFALPALQAGAWQQVTIPLSTLGVAGNGAFDGLYIENSGGSTLPEFYLDDLSLTGVTPPATVQVSVDATTVLRTVDGRLYGANLAVWDSALSSGATAGLLSALQTNIVRFPGGSAADNYDWQVDRPVTDSSFQWASSAATFAQVTAAQGAQAFVTVNYGSGTPQEAAAWVAYDNGATTTTTALGTDSKGRNWQTVGYWASLRAAAPLANDDGYNFLRLSHPAPFGFKYWELGNECYGSWETDQHGQSGSGLTGAQWDAVTYASAFATFRQQMRAVDPTIHLGAVSVPGEDSFPGSTTVTNPVTQVSHQGWTPVLLTTLQQLAVTPDFLINHRYPQNPSYDGNPSDGDECDALLLQASLAGATDASDLRTQLTDYLAAAGAGVEIDFTELNSISTNPGKQSVSLVNALFLADSVGVLTQTEVNACVWWDFRNGTLTTDNNAAWLYGWRQYGDYGLVASGDQASVPVNSPYPTYYAATLLTHWARGGDQALATTSNYAGLSAYGARLASGNLALLVINKSPTATLTAQFTINGFSPGSPTANVWQYGINHDLNSTGPAATTLAGVSDSFSSAFPPYSITVLQLAGPAAPQSATVAANAITTNAVTLNGTVDPDGATTTAWFQYSTNPNFTTASTQTVTFSPNNDDTTHSVSANLSGLAPGTLYYYELIATNADGTTTSNVGSFTTAAGVPTLPAWGQSILLLVLTALGCHFLVRPGAGASR